MTTDNKEPSIDLTHMTIYTKQDNKIGFAYDKLGNSYDLWHSRD